MAKRIETFTGQLLRQAGIEINGNRPWDLTVHNSSLYGRIGSQGALGLGEAYLDGWWDAQSLDQFFDKVLSAELDNKVKWNFHGVLSVLCSKLLNLQTRRRSLLINERHYDVGNDLYKVILGKRMSYTCAYWSRGATTLDQAQEAKLDLVCRKIGLQEGDHVLDVGCGWGGFAKFAALHYRARVTGVTISREQAGLAARECEGLPVEIRLQDYREIHGAFNHVVSMGMIEHVGNKNYNTLMNVVERCLLPGGLFLLHSIGSNASRNHPDPWLAKYIFPNSKVPSAKEIIAAIEDKFVMEDWHNFGADYDRTLMAWHENFEKGWEKLRAHYDERFRRMWRYYLMSCAGAFRARRNQLWQIVLSRKGVRGGYQSLR
jgi:cyclopropane-fatty-acyl-phospholipid synthase